MLPYVVQTHATMESIAAGNISSSVRTKHFHVFLPLVLVPARRVGLSRRQFTSIDTKLEPLIPGYLFVIMDLEDARWRHIVSMRGVKKILGADVLSPTPVNRSKFEEFRRRFETGEFTPPLPQATPAPRAQDYVTVTAGSFINRSGVCLMSRKQRAKILLPMLKGGAIETWVPIGNLRVDKRPGVD